DGWELAERVRGCVRFDVGNIADPAFLSCVSGAYDLVLCRNLLIYLTPAARREALATLERILMPGGLLAVGPAEPPPLAGRPLRRDGTEPHFLFRYDPSSPPDAPQRLPTVRETPFPRRAIEPEAQARGETVTLACASGSMARTMKGSDPSLPASLPRRGAER